MVHQTLHALVRHLHGNLGPEEDGRTDAELLGRFVASRDEAAFEVLVWRHGPLVLGVAGRLLRQPQDAEEVFQAAFLALARRAASIGKRDSLASWLYKTAYRAALRARVAANRRARLQPLEDDAAAPQPQGDGTACDLRQLLDEEVSRLPGRYRATVILCYFQHLTTGEAARQLGCARGTVNSRLAWARQRLRGRLIRRGLAPAVAGLALTLPGRSSSAGLPLRLVVSTVRAATSFAAGQATPAGAAALAEGVLRTMMLNKMKKLTAVVLAALAICAGFLLATTAPAERTEEGLPIYLHPAMLAEAAKPGVDPASGGGFWNPGPERFYGWALRDLRDCLQKMTGDRHLLTAAAPEAKRGIFAGTFDQFPAFKPQHARARQALLSPDPEAFVIEVQGERLFVLGKSKAGLIAAIYTLLDGLGCKWFAPGKAWESLPQRKGLTLDARLDAASTGPSYQARHFFPSYGVNSSILHKGERERDYALWCLRNRMGGSAYVANYHNDPGMISPTLFDKRPELFALVAGKRNSYALSRANPDTVALAIDSAVKYLKDNAGKGSYYHSFSVETNDGSPACEESLKKIGNHTATDLNYWFANQVAAGLDRAGLKDKWVGMCSYSDHAGVPSFDLHPRVGVVVTTALDFSSKMTVEQRLDGLRRRKCRRLGVYEYLNLITWSLDKPGCSPATDPRLVAANLKRYHDHGARTYLAETSDSWASGGAGHYLAARLLWNIKADPRKEVDAYYKGAFGPAAVEVRALAEDWANLPLKVKMPPGALPGMPKITRGRCARWHQWISRAEARVKGQPVYRARLNTLKRYWLYLNLWREFELDLATAKVPTREERYLRLVRYVGAGRGEGAFHALGLLPTLQAAAPQQGLTLDKWPEELQALAKNITDAAAWKAFPPLSDAHIDRMFAAAELPLDGHATRTLDPRLELFPGDARPPAAIKFPKLHGPPAVLRQYVLRVVAPTPRLTFQVLAGSPYGGGIAERTCVVTDAKDNEVKRVEFKADRPARFELTDLKPGVYTATFPEFGAEQVTVSGGNTFGAVRAFADSWGFNPLRRSDQKDKEEVRAYFLVPAGKKSLRVRLSEGTITLSFQGGGVIAAAVKGKAKGTPQEFTFAPSDKPRVACVQMGRNQLSTVGMVIAGVTLYSPDPAHVLFESLE